MKTEAWLKRKIELKEQLVTITLEEIGDLTRELMVLQGKAVNGHGPLIPVPELLRKALNCAPIYDPFVDSKDGVG